MDRPENFEILGQYACSRPAGKVSLEQAAGLVRSAIAYAAQQRISKLLIDITQLTGFDSPGITGRYQISQGFATAASFGMKVVMVAKQEMIDPDKFGVTVARNRGLLGNVFPTEKEALAWLLDQEV